MLYHSVSIVPYSKRKLSKLDKCCNIYPNDNEIEDLYSIRYIDYYKILYFLDKYTNISISKKIKIYKYITNDIREFDILNVLTKSDRLLTRHIKRKRGRL